MLTVTRIRFSETEQTSTSLVAATETLDSQTNGPGRYLEILPNKWGNSEPDVLGQRQLSKEQEIGPATVISRTSGLHNAKSG